MHAKYNQGDGGEEDACPTYNTWWMKDIHVSMYHEILIAFAMPHCMQHIVACIWIGHAAGG